MEQNGVQSERIVVVDASLSLIVDDVDESAKTALSLIKSSGGYVQEQATGPNGSMEMKLRIPAAKIEDVLSELEKLGEIESKKIEARDMTDAYMDREARLKSLHALRDRLKTLLDKAADVKDILQIEKELARIQGDIDSMEAKNKILKDKSDMATVELNLRKGKILGPLGYVFYGLFWSLGKLFVIRD